MTKYVLNSGNVRGDADLAKKFFGEIFFGLGESPRLLLCCFAQPREDWEQKFKRDTEFISGLFEGTKKPILELAFPDAFVEQLQECDAVFIHGGDQHLLSYWLDQFDLPHAWEGKVVATSSASSHWLSKSFWTCDWRTCMDGEGVFPIKFLAHYDSTFGNDDPRGPIDWQAAYDELAQYGDTSLPIHALKEGEFVVLEQ